MKRLLIIAAVLAVIYVIASPFLAAWQIGAAARDRDSEALSESVDFPVLRQNLKDQLNAELLGNAVEETDSSLLGSIGAAIGGVFIDKAVDAWVTPDAIFRLMRGNKAKERSGDRPQPGGEEDGSDTGAARKAENPFRQAAFSYASWDRFNVTIQSRNDEPVTFVLRRRGLGWKLTNIILPLSERSPLVSAERLAVRDATANDLPALRSLYLRARQDAFTWLETGNYTLHDFDADTAGEQIRVAASDAGTVLGFSSLWRQDLFIHHLYVLPGHERRGVGRALIDDLRNRYGSADLALKCQSRNTRALAFYHALGFEPVESATGPDGPNHLLRLPHTRSAR